MSAMWNGRALAVLAGAVLFSTVGSAAYAVQAGRSTGVNSDGSFATITGSSFSPAPSQCVIFSTLAHNESTGAAQIQSGETRCNGGQGLFMTCKDVKFVEALYSPLAGFCYPHGSFTNGVSHDYKVQRISAGSSGFTGYIDGNAYETLGGFAPGNAVRMWAWAEDTNTTSCSNAHGSGKFQNWQKLDIGSGWTFTNGTPYPACWSVSGVDANRTWYVTK